jgi:hypothetical protein
MKAKGEKSRGPISLMNPENKVGLCALYGQNIRFG